MKPSTSTIALGLLSGSTLTVALRVPVQRRAATTHEAVITGFSSTPTSSNAAGGSNGSDITNAYNVFYTTELTIGGAEVPVLLDTGSADLWVYPESYPGIFANVHNFTDVPVVGSYGPTSVEGFLAVTNVSFAGFDVDDQAFVAVEKVTGLEDVIALGIYGVMGLGFDSSSRVNNAVHNKYNATWGRSLLSNLFLQEPNTPNHIAFALDRAGDLYDMAEGAFDVGEISPEYAAVSQSSPIPLWPDDSDQWTILLDDLTVGGSSIPLNSTFEGDNATDPPAGKSVALLDTGVGLGVIPKWAVDAIYGSIPGSAYSADLHRWIVPCMGEQQVSFTLGGVVCPIHPLDLTSAHTHTMPTGENVTFCYNDFVAAPTDPLPFDFLLGGSFLRNVYSVYDFGDFDASGKMGDPYVKLLPLTDHTSASDNFKKNRALVLSQLPAEGDISKLGLTSSNPSTSSNEAPPTSSSSAEPPASSSSGAPASKNAAAKEGLGASLASTTTDDNDPSIAATLNKLTSLAPIALALLGVNVALLLGLLGMGTFFLVRRNRAKGATLVGPSTSNTRGIYAPVTKFPQAEEDDRSHTPAARYDTPEYRDGTA